MECRNSILMVKPLGKTITQIQKKSSNLILASKLQLAATGVFIASGPDLCSSVIAIATGVTTGVSLKVQQGEAEH